MSLASVALAAALVERFRPLVPADVLVLHDEDMLVLRRDATMGWVGVGLDVTAKAPPKEVEAAAHGAMRALQEFLQEQLSHPWPTPGAHEPGVAVREDELRLWFGAEEAPALVLPPVSLPSLRK